MRLGSAGSSRAAEGYAAGLFLLYAFLVLLHAGGPSLTDYANWTYQGILLREHLVGHPDTAHLLKHYPVPNSLTTFGIAILALVLPWLTATKLWLIAQLFACFAAMRFLLRTVDAPALAWVVVPQAVFLNVNFWYGFMNFELGLAWVMLLTALLLRKAPPWLLAIVLLLAFFTHMIPFCFCVVLLCFHALQTRRLRNLWAATPAFALTLWYVAARFLQAADADGQSGMRETVRNYSAAFWVFKLNSYAKSFGFVNPLGVDQALFGRTGLYALLLAETLLALTAGWALIASMRKSFGKREETSFVWQSILLLLPVFLLAPGAALGISDPGSRVLQAGLALGLVFCWATLAKPVRTAAGICAGALAAGGLLLFGFYGGALRRPQPATPEQNAAAAKFARIPNNDQDYFYEALERGDFDRPVFPTGLLLNRKAEPPPASGAVLSR